MSTRREPVRSRRVEIETASCMKVADAVQMAAEKFATAEGFDENTAHYLAVALREALVNAIKHGNGSDPERRIKMSFGIDSRNCLVFTVRDDGAGFDPTAVPDPLEPDNLGRGSGRGIFYMKKFTDQVSFAFPKRGGTVVCLKKRLPRRSLSLK